MIFTSFQGFFKNSSDTLSILQRKLHYYTGIYAPRGNTVNALMRYFYVNTLLSCVAVLFSNKFAKDNGGKKK